MDDSSELVYRVKEYLRTKWEVEYCGSLDYKVSGSCYELHWGLNNPDFPLIMVGDFESEDDFFNYICKEIDRKKFFRVGYFIAKRILEEDLKCKEND